MPFRLLTRPPFTRYPLSVGKVTKTDAAYQAAVLGLSPIAYWPLTETSGTAAVCEVDSNQNGTYTGVTLNNTTGPFGAPAGLWDGSNDFVDIDTAALVTAVGTLPEFTISMWAKVSAAAVWTDSTVRRAFFISWTTLSRDIGFQRLATNNTLEVSSRGTVGTVSRSITTSTTAWFHIACTHSVSGNVFRVYFNNVQQGADQADGGAKAGALDIAQIGSRLTTPTEVWSGHLAHVAIFDSLLSAPNIATLYNGGPI